MIFNAAPIPLSTWIEMLGFTRATTKRERSRNKSQESYDSLACINLNTKFFQFFQAFTMYHRSYNFISSLKSSNGSFMGKI
jgi:hypothetical protein